MHTHTHTNKQTFTYCTHTHKHKHSHTVHTHAHTYTTHIDTYTMYTHKYAHTHICTCTHTCTHAHTCTCTHQKRLCDSFVWFIFCIYLEQNHTLCQQKLAGIQNVVFLSYLLHKLTDVSCFTSVFFQSNACCPVGVDLLQLINEQEGSDVVFVIGTQKIRAHR